MDKMWAGRFTKALAKEADDFNSSLHFDSVMYKQDIKGSMAHASMLAEKGILLQSDVDTIIDSLGAILSDIESGKLPLSGDDEDIHMFVEAELTRRIGDIGKKLHTARSRNDQVAVDLRLYMRDECEGLTKMLDALILSVLQKAKENKDTVMPGYTHLQRAQPIVFAQQLLAYAMMFLRDRARIHDAVGRMNYSPLGACALAGTTYDTDRLFEAQKLGFDGITQNSIDSVSDRDYCVELLSAFSLIMMHLSRFSEEIILWSSWEFKFIELDDSYTTGSSIMPQKKNPDIAELVRGKTGRVYGDLLGTLTMLKGLPLAYNKDMQEDKESIFDALNTVKQCLRVFPGMIDGMKVLKENMESAAKKGFINATDLADYLTKKGMPFRTAYKISGKAVAYCIQNGKVLDTMTIDEYKNFSDKIEEDVYKALDIRACVESRISEGGTGRASVEKQILYVEEQLAK